MAAPTLATGITISWESGFLGEIIDVTPFNETRNMINVSHQGTTNAHIFTVAKLVDWGEATFNIMFDPGLTPPVNDDFSAMVITFPDGETELFSGAMSGYSPTGTLDDKMTATVIVKISGAVSMTEDSSGA